MAAPSRRSARGLAPETESRTTSRTQAETKAGAVRSLNRVFYPNQGPDCRKPVRPRFSDWVRCSSMILERWVSRHKASQVIGCTPRLSILSRRQQLRQGRSKRLQTVKSIHVAVERNRAASVQKDDVFTLLEMTLPAQVNQTGHAFAGIHRVKQATRGDRSVHRISTVMQVDPRRSELGGYRKNYFSSVLDSNRMTALHCRDLNYVYQTRLTQFSVGSALLLARKCRTSFSRCF